MALWTQTGFIVAAVVVVVVVVVPFELAEPHGQSAGGKTAAAIAVRVWLAATVRALVALLIETTRRGG